MEDEESTEARHGSTWQQDYEGEDLSPTTTRELRGFYAYGLAAEVFAVCGVGSFLPVTLEQLARERGVLWSDRTMSCMANKAAEEAGAATALLLSRSTETKDNQCVVKVLGVEMTTSSFAMYTFSIAVFVQALALVSFSSTADYGTYRKKFLIVFGLTGAFSCMLFLLVVPSIFALGSLLVIVGVTCLGSSFVILNSFLPLLVSNHPLVRRQDDRERPTSVDMTPLPLTSRRNSSPGLPNRVHSDQDETGRQEESPVLKVSNMISTKGVGIGYAAAVLVQILCILLLFSLSKTRVSSTLPLRMVLFLVGLWWLAFTIPASLWLRDRPGPPLKTSMIKGGRLRQVLAYLSFSWRSVWRTVRLVGQLRQGVQFLIAWFFLSDAVATVSGTAILFARTELRMGTVAIALLSITATSSGIAGAFCWPVISHRYNWRTNRIIVACIFLMEIIPLYGLLGYLPFVQAWGVGGLQQAWEIYPLAFIHGFVMGGLSSYCRSMFGLLIPPGSEVAFYALYAVTDKGSSAVGPAIVGTIVDATGQIRPAFGFLAILIAIPAPLIWLVDVEKGQADAIRLADVMKRSRLNEEGPRELVSQEGQRLMHDHD